MIDDTPKWSEADKREEEERIALADQRLAAWARWTRTHGLRIGYPASSPFVRVMEPPKEQGQIGARHLVTEASDEEAMQVDLILARWRLNGSRRYCKIIDIEYFTGGSSEQKARRIGLSRIDYRARLRHVQLMLAHELDGGAVGIRSRARVRQQH